ncbi:DNA-3-methyladenine glycosylase 2 family protein [Candidatus Gottesmanbacteria bacterium]|nr:DNA-3-methyladenine glycosylase 2 family protein [Candidatus Gottesmanbacteria bacterium]
MKDTILAHFKSTDPIFYSLLQKVSLQKISKRLPDTYFHSLCHEIIGQQLSGRVADVLCDRFDKLFGKHKVIPEGALKFSEKKLRAIGMSWAKARFIRDMADKVLSKSVQLSQLDQLSDDEVVRELTKVKGIGPWTAEMFLMFTLGREDVFSFGDLGLRKAIMKLYKLRKEPSKKQLEKITKKWSPYRTHAALVLWRSLDI